MPAETIPIPKIREVLRLRLEARLSSPVGKTVTEKNRAAPIGAYPAYWFAGLEVPEICPVAIQHIQGFLVDEEGVSAGNG